jgi:hypothetical protein
MYEVRVRQKMWRENEKGGIDPMRAFSMRRYIASATGVLLLGGALVVQSATPAGAAMGCSQTDDFKARNCIRVDFSGNTATFGRVGRLYGNPGTALCNYTGEIEARYPNGNRDVFKGDHQPNCPQGPAHWVDVPAIADSWFPSGTLLCGTFIIDGERKPGVPCLKTG